MIRLIATLSRSVPLVIALVLLAIVAYFVLQFKYSPPRAKSILIKMFIVITGALSAFFALACLYALLEGNMAVLELFAAFLAVTAVGLVIVLVCRYRFLKHNPEYRKRARRTSGTSAFPWLTGKRRR